MKSFILEKYLDRKNLIKIVHKFSKFDGTIFLFSACDEKETSQNSFIFLFPKVGIHLTNDTFSKTNKQNQNHSEENLFHITHEIRKNPKNRWKYLKKHMQNENRGKSFDYPKWVGYFNYEMHQLDISTTSKNNNIVYSVYKLRFKCFINST